MTTPYSNFIFVFYKQTNTQKKSDWVGDVESETGGRIGLWKTCERNEMSDVCIGKLEDVLEMPTMSTQVSFNEN